MLHLPMLSLTALLYANPAAVTLCLSLTALLRSVCPPLRVCGHPQDCKHTVAMHVHEQHSLWSDHLDQTVGIPSPIYVQVAMHHTCKFEGSETLMLAPACRPWGISLIPQDTC